MLTSLRLAIVIVGIGLTYTPLTIYWKRVHKTSLLYVSIGFALITAGSGFEFLFLDFGYSLTVAHTIGSAITGVALAIILYAIHVTR